MIGGFFFLRNYKINLCGAILIARKEINLCNLSVISQAYFGSLSSSQYIAIGEKTTAIPFPP